MKVKGWRTGWTDSDTAIATYTFNLGTVATPTATPDGGTYTTAQTVTLATSTAGAVIRYTTDGTDPTLTSKVFVTAMAISQPSTLKFRALKVDWTPSAIVTASYVFDYGTVAIPTLVPPGGDYPSARTVTVSTTTTGATIRYTTDGREPTETDATISSGGTLLVDRAVRVRAKAFKTGSTPSAVATGDYWITGTVAAGNAHTLALKADGTVWSWGSNSQGQLGDNTQTQRTSPVLVNSLTEVVAIAAGSLHSLAVKRDGSVWAWGYTGTGQLGEPTTTIRRLIPVQVAGVSDVMAVAAGESHSLALKRDGTVCGWGANSSGQLGDGTITMRTSPVCISSLTGVTAIAAGARHSIALKTDGAPDGTVWTWGVNNYGQLADGSTVSYRSTPLVILAGAVSVGAGYDHGMAVLVDGSSRSWGRNGDGQLGDGTQTNRFRPVVVADLAGIVTISGGASHTLGRTTDGSAWTCGDGRKSALVDIDSFIAIASRVAGTGSNVIATAAGGDHSVAARRDGSVWTWGLNGNGQLADANLLPRQLPQAVAGFSLSDANWLTSDQDGDGLPTWRELQIGTDPLNSDSNDDGFLDGAADSAGQSATSTDMDGDGLSNSAERAIGTDPFRSDTDGDDVTDATDAFPLDPTRSQPPAPTPGDMTPPTIILLYPTNAILIGG